ncbi:MAG: hypothetical protein ACD_39C01154G0005 [uncultured bacterium]|nr:MAG: hypothetical protein ACD_39C01154G0005 [uncultured bacterium]
MAHALVIFAILAFIIILDAGFRDNKSRKNKKKNSQYLSGNMWADKNGKWGEKYQPAHIGHRFYALVRIEAEACPVDKVTDAPEPDISIIHV